MNYDTQTSDIYSKEKSITDKKEIKKEFNVKCYEANDKAMGELDNIGIDRHVDQDTSQVFFKSKRDTEKYEVDKWLEQTFNLSNNKTNNDSLNISCDKYDATMVKIENGDDSNKCSNKHSLKSTKYSSDENLEDESDDTSRNASDVKFKEFEAVLNG